MNTYKILFIGDGGVGKTTYLKKVMGKSFEKKYIPTLGCEVQPIVKSGEKIILNIWDCAGQEKFGGLKDGYYVQADFAIFFFDLTGKLSFMNLQNWIRDCKRVCGEIPFVIVGTKSDLKQQISDAEIKKYLKNIPFIKISSKSGENLELLISCIISKLN